MFKKFLKVSFKSLGSSSPLISKRYPPLPRNVLSLSAELPTSLSLSNLLYGLIPFSFFHLVADEKESFKIRGLM